MIRRYFEAFNRHTLEGVMACFHPEPVVVDSQGARHEGAEAVRRLYVEQFALAPDGRCDLRSAAGGDGRGMAESLFHGTRARDGRPIQASGVEVFDFVDGRIKEDPGLPQSRGVTGAVQRADKEGLSWSSS